MSDDNSDTIMEAIIVGAGFAGLCAGIKLKEAGISDFLILEKADEPGGTWAANTYPGAKCDVKSHFYSYTFAPNPDWSHAYAGQEEIQAYIQHCIERFDLAGDIRYGTFVSQIRFDDRSGLWQVICHDSTVLTARFIINATGTLHRPNIPEFAGRGLYKGAVMHSAEWDHSVELEGKRLAVVGSAASAIQIVPELAKVARSVAVFQRSANYVLPRHDRPYSGFAKTCFKAVPMLARLHRWTIQQTMDLVFFPITQWPKYRKNVAQWTLRKMAKIVRDPDLRARLKPHYHMGCRRMLLSDHYYEALQADNVSLITQPIAGFHESGLTTTDSRNHELDAVVLATGFDVGAHFRAIPVTGPGGLRLSDVWEQSAEAYKGVMVAGFPNYFLVTGPNTIPAATSVVFLIECAVDWIVKAVRLAGEDQLVAVSGDAQDRYNADIRARLASGVWSSGCSSWYRGADGRIETLFPGNARQFQRQLRNVDLTDIALQAREQFRGDAEPLSDGEKPSDEVKTKRSTMPLTQ